MEPKCLDHIAAALQEFIGSIMNPQCATIKALHSENLLGCVKDAILAT